MAEEMLKQVKFDIDKLEAVRGTLNIAVREDRVRALCRPASPRIDWSRGWRGLWQSRFDVREDQRKRKDQ